MTMRHTHLGGDKLFVDYADDTVPVIVVRRSGKTQLAHVVGAVMGGSSLSLASATWSEKLPGRVKSGHEGAARGVPESGTPGSHRPNFQRIEAAPTCSGPEVAVVEETVIGPARPTRS